MCRPENVKTPAGLFFCPRQFFCVPAGFCGALVSLALACCPSTASGQDVRQFLDDGEFSAAIVAAGKDPVALQAIATTQMSAGQSVAAFKTASQIRDWGIRNDTYQRFQSSDDLPSGHSSPAGTIPDSGGGSEGGISANDYNTLIQLIQNTVDADTWEANGGGNGTMVPYPSGVMVDAKGTLDRIPKSGLRLASRWSVGNRFSEQQSVQRTSKLRKVSLTRLERAVQLRAAQGRAASETMRYLAGLTEIRFVMIEPESGEVIIAGPAGGWTRSVSGKTISTLDQQPVLLLDDFVVCLRNAMTAQGKFGCAIVPRKENLAATKKYLAAAAGRGKKWEAGLQDALGQQDIEVFGIPATTHAARVLVEADHHMKLLGMGIEPTIPAVPSYLQRIKLDAAGNPPPLDVVRWWFTLNYDRLLCNEAQTLFEFSGPGARVLAETELVNEAGERIHTGKAIGPTKTFARDFSDHFATLADVYPVYQELKNIFDLAICANLIREFRLREKSHWRMSHFLPQPSSAGFEVARFNAARTVDSVINRRTMRRREDSATVIHTIVGVSGGVSFDAAQFVNRENLKMERDIEFTQTLGQSTEDLPEYEVWWWD